MATLRLKTSAPPVPPEELDLVRLSEPAADDTQAAWRLWDALGKGAERADLIAVLLDEVEGLDPDRAADDVDAFLDALRDLDLLEEGLA